LLVIFSTSCKTAKKANESTKLDEAQELFSTKLYALEYETFSGRMKTSLRVGNMFDINAHLKIIKDDKLQLSFQVPILGEVVKFAVSNDSLIIIDRVNKQFVAESIEEIKQTSSFDFNLQHLQSLFTDRYTEHIRHVPMAGDNDTITMDWVYDNFSELDDKQLFPMQMGINLKSPSKQFSMNFSFSQIDLNKEVEIDLNIPKKYSRVTLAQAMNLINSMK